MARKRKHRVPLESVEQSQFLGTGDFLFQPLLGIARDYSRMPAEFLRQRRALIERLAKKGKLKHRPRWLMSPAQKRADNRRKAERRKAIRRAGMAKYHGKYGDGQYVDDEGALDLNIPCPRGLHDLGLDADDGWREEHPLSEWPRNPLAVDSEGRCRVCRAEDKRLLRLEKSLGLVGKVIRSLGGRGLYNDWWYLRDPDSGEYRHGGYRVHRIRRALEILWERSHPPVYVPAPDAVL